MAMTGRPTPPIDTRTCEREECDLVPFADTRLCLIHYLESRNL